MSMIMSFLLLSLQHFGTSPSWLSDNFRILERGVHACRPAALPLNKDTAGALLMGKQVTGVSQLSVDFHASINSPLTTQ